MTNEFRGITDSDPECPNCHKLVSAHPLTITFADIGTSRDCRYMSEILRIEVDLVDPILRLCGVSVGGEVRRNVAIRISEWRKRS